MLQEIAGVSMRKLNFVASLLLCLMHVAPLSAFFPISQFSQCRISKAHERALIKDTKALHRKGSKRFKKSLAFRKQVFCVLNKSWQVPSYIVCEIIDKYERAHPKSYRKYAPAIYQEALAKMSKKDRKTGE